MAKRVLTSVKSYRNWNRIGTHRATRIYYEGLNKHPPIRAPNRWVWKQIPNIDFMEV